jgi:hypothetical protein
MLGREGVLADILVDKIIINLNSDSDALSYIESRISSSEGSD